MNVTTPDNILIFKRLLFLYLLIAPFFSEAQGNTVIRGTITDTKGESIPEAAIVVSDSLNGTPAKWQTLSDAKGNFQFTGLKQGSFVVTVSHIGFQTSVLTVSIASGENRTITVRLPDKTHDLADVLVAGKTETSRATEQAIKAVVVNTREVHQQPVSLTELINRSAGVRIRQTGGLGSAPEVSVNGFQGRSVRYFKDGIPIDYLRDGYNLATVPVNMLDRVEIYKGVLPVSIGADALGGAVNLVRRKNVNPFLDVTYEIASFNTHRIALNGYHTNTKGTWFAGTQAFYNRSDNDYKALLKVTDPVTKNQKYERLRLFHNAFNSYYAEIFAGIAKRSWADELRLSLAVFELERQQQHPALMTDAYGAITGRQQSWVPTVNYRKTWADEKISVNHFMVYNTLTMNRTDTLQGVYDWYGNFTSQPWRVGESRQAALSEVNFDNFISRTHFSYRLHANQLFELNHVYSSSRRTGRDPYGIRFDGTDTDVLSIPAVYEKQIITAGLESTLGEGRFTNHLMAKYFRFRSRGTEAWAARPIEQDEEVTQTGSYWGVAEAIKYEINPFSFLRLSAELANRLPEQDELFGDAMWIVPNFNLQPERSVNLNLGYRISKPKNYSVEINSFYRRTTRMILLVPTQAPYAQYQNMENVKGYGLEADGQLVFAKRYTLSANATWQSVRLFGFDLSQDQWKNGARLRNTPYFFANTGLSGLFANLLKPRDVLSTYLHYNFIREYYLETIPKSVEPRGFLGLSGSANIQSELVIPTQHLLSAGFSYQPGNRRFSIGAEVKNLLNTDLYDYFRVQKAGRSFHLKLGVQIQKNNS